MLRVIFDQCFHQIQLLLVRAKRTNERAIAVWLVGWLAIGLVGSVGWIVGRCLFFVIILFR